MPDNTLSELFARDPFSMTKKDIDDLIEAFREARKNFHITGKGQAPTTKRPVDLSDLGLV